VDSPGRIVGGAGDERGNAGANVMTDTLRILHLEDDLVDAELIEATLRNGGVACEIVRVCSRHEFLTALDGLYDLILSDYSMPGFDGVTAQAIARERRPDLPFVFVSGTIGEEVAIDRLKEGATDYVLKQRLARLPSAVRRALDERQERRKRRRAEAEVRRLNQELEARVVERTAQLATANAAVAAREAQLAEATAFLQQLVAASPSIILRFEPDDLRVTYASPNLGWLLGYSVEEVVDVPGFWPEIVHPDDQIRVLRRLREAMDATVVQMEQEYRLRAKDGRYRWVFNLLRIEYDDLAQPTAILGYVLDIADRKAAEEEARLARQQAERANRAKSEFLSRMSHDLRTPLNAILGFAQLLELELGEPTELESVRQILNGGTHLLDLINEVLDIAAIEAGRLRLSPETLPLTDTVLNVVELLRPLADMRQIAVSCEIDPLVQVRGDRQRLRQVLVNLIGNAVKYNRTAGTVRVTTSATGDAGMIRINVHDTGEGIASDKIARLFKPFERLGAEHGPVEGTGLGLAVAKGLTEAMDGSIGVESEVGRGTTFWVELPRAQPAASADAAAAFGVPDADPVRSLGTVLYIEDNQSNVRLMQRVMARRPGMVLIAAASGREGLAIAANKRPDVIFLDLQLPDMHGEEVLAALRREAGTADVPIAVLSADSGPAQMERLRAAGADAYFPKPIHIARLLKFVDRSARGRA
jgi:PAS domain S-box-containing protein